jgi:hypothetical protein
VVSRVFVVTQYWTSAINVLLMKDISLLIGATLVHTVLMVSLLVVAVEPSFIVC